MRGSRGGRVQRKGEVDRCERDQVRRMDEAERAPERVVDDEPGNGDAAISVLLGRIFAADPGKACRTHHAICRDVSSISSIMAFCSIEFSVTAPPSRPDS